MRQSSFSTISRKRTILTKFKPLALLTIAVCSILLNLQIARGQITTDHMSVNMCGAMTSDPYYYEYNSVAGFQY